MSNTTDITDAADLLWQVVRSGELCARHHECQISYNLLLTALLQLQKLSCRLPIPTSSTPTTKPSGEAPKELQQSSPGLNPPERSSRQSPTSTSMGESHIANELEDMEWGQILESRDSADEATHSKKSTDIIQRSLNGI